MVLSYAFMQISQVSDRDKMFEVTTVGALTAGLLSFLSPCVLPIVPFYVSYFAGSRLNEAQASENTIISGRARAVTSSIFFSLGIITVFVALGANASTLGVLMQDWFDVLRLVAACLLIVMGLHFLGTVQIAAFHRQVRIETRLIDPSKLVGAYVVGLAFAFGWTPCVGPVLAAILFTAAAQDTAVEGAQLLFVYGAGMTLPFVLISLFVDQFTSWMSRFRAYLGIVKKVTGLCLITFGILVGTDQIGAIAQVMLDYLPWFSRLG
jgi:cytochrome c-type biogenesis protein